jgi:quinate dehydrogenase
MDAPNKKFGLYGFPILHSASPAFHNLIFNMLGEGKSYTTFSTGKVIPEMLEELRKEQFGGCR